MVQNTRSNTCSKFSSSSLGLILYLSREFKAQLPLTSVAIVSSQHLCKPDPVLSGQKHKKSETEGTTCEVCGLSDRCGFLEELYNRSKDRGGITCLVCALTLFSLCLLRSTLDSFSSHLTVVFHTKKAFCDKQLGLIPTAYPCCEVNKAQAVWKRGELHDRAAERCS